MPSSRREFARVAVGVLGVTAGCGDATSGGRLATDSTDSTDTAVNVASDPPHVTLRRDATEPVVAAADETPGAEGRESLPWDTTLVDGSEVAASLSIDADDGVDRAREFLDATDFDAETVYVEEHAVGECFARRLCRVRWSETEIETEYADELRDADVACDADGRDAQATLIRLPAVLDSGRLRSRSSASGSGDCDEPGRAAGEGGGGS
ncbi:MAG: hypothetical protein ABEJ79_10415 [Halolamina sp.]